MESVDFVAGEPQRRWLVEFGSFLRLPGVAAAFGGVGFLAF